VVRRLLIQKKPAPTITIRTTTAAMILLAVTAVVIRYITFLIR